MHVYEVLRRPIDTEKTRRLAELDNQYVFEVDRRANKQQIKEAVETIFGVTVLAVNVSCMPAKLTRYGRRRVVSEPAWKKAVVTLAPEDRLTIFEGV